MAGQVVQYVVRAWAQTLPSCVTTGRCLKLSGSASPPVRWGQQPGYLRATWIHLNHEPLTQKLLVITAAPREPRRGGPSPMLRKSPVQFALSWAGSNSHLSLQPLCSEACHPQDGPGLSWLRCRRVGPWGYKPLPQTHLWEGSDSKSPLLWESDHFRWTSQL